MAAKAYVRLYEGRLPSLSGASFSLTANAGNANNERNVQAAGGFNNNNANNAYAVRAD